MKIYVYLPCSYSCIYLDKDFLHNDTMFDFSQDIPALAAEASKEHSNVPYIVTAPLGLHELMVVCSCEFPLDYFYRIQQSLIERQSRYDVNLICSYLHNYTLTVLPEFVWQIDHWNCCPVVWKGTLEFSTKQN